MSYLDDPRVLFQCCDDGLERSTYEFGVGRPGQQGLSHMDLRHVASRSHVPRTLI
jgi:hypothetical protein